VGEFVRSHPLLFGTPTESSPISSSDIFSVDEFFDLPLFRPHAAPRVGLVEEDRSNGGEGPAAWVSVRVASGIVGAGRGHVSVGQALAIALMPTPSRYIWKICRTIGAASSSGTRRCARCPAAALPGFGWGPAPGADSRMVGGRRGNGLYGRPDPSSRCESGLVCGCVRPSTSRRRAS
jgi:hypothetical protein